MLPDSSETRQQVRLARKVFNLDVDLCDVQEYLKQVQVAREAFRLGKDLAEGNRNELQDILDRIQLAREAFEYGKTRNIVGVEEVMARRDWL